MESITTLTVARRYADAVSAKDFAAVAGMFAEDIVWHQPGDNAVSGTYRGMAAVNGMLGAQMAATQGTFELRLTGDPMVNGALAAMPVRFSARRDGAEMAMDGVDLLRVEGDKIMEVWLFSADQHAEDAFWGAG
ncbi:nuclear transport factor 2 family protein [Streptomyces sp. ALI-76-A]|uniref:nuclear transport factor 2 family protein n=1 Tax=Streptomyces sp. ALI-76-A TaxID=3025736 RepID=UPI00256F4060|nr:nuclear transport factor 2 family protein [Streptomyces sp. ALI-76-A]MDL5199238.1 nuclear transport factor 2 family protein [Streptomyces sp. ALI-76-A]